MYLICLQDHPDGVYSVVNEEGDNVIFFFEEEDDAESYLGLLEANNYNDLPDLQIIELDIEVASKVCETRGYKYTIITPDDVIIPPYDNF
jgi:hypothetical protein